MGNPQNHGNTSLINPISCEHALKVPSLNKASMQLSMLLLPLVDLRVRRYGGRIRVVNQIELKF